MVFRAGQGGVVATRTPCALHNLWHFQASPDTVRATQEAFFPERGFTGLHR
jgi:hypothetical protein